MEQYNNNIFMRELIARYRSRLLELEVIESMGKEIAKEIDKHFLDELLKS